MLGQNIAADHAKLTFALAALKGNAHDWYKCLTIRADFESSYAYFRTKFAHKYRIPGHAHHEFDVTSLSKQRFDEDPYQYLARIKAYFDNASPSTLFTTWTDNDANAFTDRYNAHFVVAGADGDNVLKTRVKDIVDHFGALWVSRTQTFHVRHVWLNGLLPPYSDIAKAQDRTKEFGALVDKVQDEGAAKIHRNSFRDHAAALRAYSAARHRNNTSHSTSNTTSNNNGFNRRAIHEVDSSATAAPPTEDVNAVNMKKCNYCKRRGHLISECRKKARRDAEGKGKTNSSSTPNQSHSSSAVRKDPAMEQLFKSWVQSINDKSNANSNAVASAISTAGSDFL